MKFPPIQKQRVVLVLSLLLNLLGATGAIDPLATSSELCGQSGHNGQRDLTLLPAPAAPATPQPADAAPSP